jgi:hypothetical protein
VTTLIDFTVTEEGLTEQLLVRAMAQERPELLARQSTLLKQGAKSSESLGVLEERVFALLGSVSGEVIVTDELIAALSNVSASPPRVQLMPPAAHVLCARPLCCTDPSAAPPPPRARAIGCRWRRPIRRRRRSAMMR